MSGPDNPQTNFSSNLFSYVYFLNDYTCIYVYFSGCLGLGTEDDHSTPQEVFIRGCHSIKAVYASMDGTFVLNTSGRILACGSNEHNKLGMNNTAHGIRQSNNQVITQVEYHILICFN